MLFAYIMIAKHIQVYMYYWFINHFIITKTKGGTGSQLVNTPMYTQIALEVRVAAMNAVQTFTKAQCDWTLWRCTV